MSSLSTASAGRRSRVLIQGPRQSVTSRTGPIGVQPWDSPVITGTAASSSTPDRPPSVGWPAI